MAQDHRFIAGIPDTGRSYRMSKAVNGITARNSHMKYNEKFASVLKRNYSAWLIMLPALLLFIVFAWQPIFSAIVLSFFKTKGFTTQEFIGLQNFKDVITDSVFLKALTNSLSYTLWSLVIGFALPIFIAILLNEMVHFKSFFKTAVYFPNVTPTVVTAIMWLILYDPGPNGMINNIITNLGLEPFSWLQDSRYTIILIVISMTWKGAGGTAILYLASIQGINQELYESAKVDGAGIVSRIYHITLPQISTMIALMLISQIIGVFQVMEQPLAMTDGGPNDASVSLALQSYFYAFKYAQTGKSIALSVITFLILIGFTIVYFAISKKSDVD